MAEEIILKVGVQGTGDGEQKIKNLKTQLKEMKAELMGLDQGSERFKTLSKQAGELQDHIGDVNDRVKVLSSDTKKLDALVSTGSAIAGGFQAASGAMALFGSDSKAVEKAIQHIIAVQGILNGVQQIGNFLTTEGIGKQMAEGAAKLYNAAATKVATAAQWLWNAAVTANPIGIIVVGVAALTAGIYKLVDGLRKGTITIQDINKVLWRMIMPLQLIVDLYNYLTAAATETETTLQKNSRANTDRYNKEVEQIKEKRRLETESFNNKQAEFDRNIRRLEAEGKSTAELTRLKLEAILKEKQAALQSNIDLINALVRRYEIEASLRGKSLDEFLKSIGINRQKTQELIEAQLQEQKNAVFDANTEIIAHDRETQEALIKNHKDTREEIARLDGARVELLDQQNVIVQEKEKTKYDTMASMLAEFNIAQAEKNKEQQAKDEAAAIAAAERKKAIQENYTKAVLNLQQTIFTLTDRWGKQDEVSKEKRAKRQFEINKALQLSLAVMDGYKAVTASLASAPVAVFGLPNPVGIASLAFAITTSAANIAKIAASKYSGGASSSSSSSPTLGGGGDAGSAAGNVGNTTPNINPINSGSTLLNPESQKVYVVESDITKTQKKVHSIESLATFG